MEGPLKQYVGYDRLNGIVRSFRDLVGSAVAVYEPNGEYAASTFDSPYCSFLERASRKLCGSDDLNEMMASGLWHCHESCWTEASKIAIETGQPVDLRPCRGGINIFTIPIVAEGQVIGAINFGYGAPPRDQVALQAIAERFQVERTALAAAARDYRPRPDYLIEAAKQQLREVANQIAELYLRRVSEIRLRQSEARHKQISELLTDWVYAFALTPDGDATLEWVSGNIQRVFPETPEAMTLEQWLARVHPDDRDGLADRYRGMHAMDATAAGRKLDAHYRFLAADNRYIQVQDRVRINWNPLEQRVDGFLGAARDVSHEQQAEDESRAIEVRYRELVENMSDGVAVYEIVGETEDIVFKEFNRAAERITGHTRQQILGRSLLELYPNAERLGLPEVLRRVQRTQTPEEIPLHHYHDERFDSWVENRVFPLPSGEVIAVFRDVTAQAKAERSLRESETRLRESQAYARLGYWELFADGHSSVWSQEVYRILGIDPTMPPGPETLRRLIHPEDCGRVECSLKAGLSEGTEHHVEYRVRHASGDECWVECRAKPRRGPDGRIEKLSGFFQDITERKRTEEALRVSEERFELAMKGANDGLFDWNLQTKDVYYSPRWKSMLGYGDDELEDSFATWERLVDAEGRERTWAMLREYMAGKRDSVELELRMRHKDGRWVDILSRAHLVRDQAGEPVRIVGTHVDISARKKAEEEIEHVAFHDYLTGLPNRLLFKEELRQVLAGFQRDKRRFALQMLDLDHFKDINDSLGQPVGDELLKAVAKRIGGTVRASDIFARLGGDEFALVQSDLDDVSDASYLAAKIINTISREFRIGANLVRTNVSIGISVPDQDDIALDELMSRADAALYKAKDAGRGTYAFFEDSMTVQLQREMDLTHHLTSAVRCAEFFLDYQPQFDLSSGALVGLEALLRWNHPQRGVLMPGDFLAVAEKRGLIRNISDWVLASACRQAKQWTDAGFKFGRIAVNLSAVQINDAGFQQNLIKIFEQTEVDPARIELEFTETVLMDATETTQQAIRQLSELGVRFAIDDFGTGFSSLVYLRKFHVDKIKIDREFVKDVATDPSDAEIVKATIALGTALGLTTTAEGVETPQQAEFLMRHGCNQVQGYLYGRPAPALEVEKLSRAGHVSPAFVTLK